MGRLNTIPAALGGRGRGGAREGALNTCRYYSCQWLKHWRSGSCWVEGTRLTDCTGEQQTGRRGGRIHRTQDCQAAEGRGDLVHTGVFKEESRLGLPLIAWACTVLSLSLVLVYRSFSLLLLAFLFSAYLLFLSFVFLSPPLTLTLSHYKNQGFPSFQIPLAFLFIKLCFLSPLPPHTLSFCVFALVIVFLLLFSLLTLS